MLGIESAGLTASQMAECCLSELCSADAISDEQSTSSVCVAAVSSHQLVTGPEFQDDSNVVADGVSPQGEVLSASNSSL